MNDYLPISKKDMRKEAGMRLILSMCVEMLM